jgi:hypothetical protein
MYCFTFGIFEIEAVAQVYDTVDEDDVKPPA